MGVEFRRQIYSEIAVIVLGLTAIGFCAYVVIQRQDTATAAVSWNDVATEVVEYKPRPLEADPEFKDDVLDEKHQAFEGDLIDSRTIDGWEINASAAVTRLECPDLKPDLDENLLILQPNYRESLRVAEAHGKALPSANLLDGAGKRFDDGMMAAIEIARFRGELAPLPSEVDLVEDLFRELPPDGAARPYLGGALQLAGRKPEMSAGEALAAKEHLNAFRADEPLSKPIAFYTWTPELETIWRFDRYLMQEARDGAPALAVLRELALCLKSHPDLLERYRALLDFDSKLCNPPMTLSAADLIDDSGPVADLAAKKRRRRPTAAFLLPRSSPEKEMMYKLFGGNAPPGEDIMTAFVRAIRSGQVDLSPQPEDGWYQYRVYALETLLLPTRAAEEQKLLLMASYKKRLAEAFRALMTKRRETFDKDLHDPAKGSARTAILPEPKVAPRLRVEPLPAFYLRTARSYSYLANLFAANLDSASLHKLHRLTEDGARPDALDDELKSLRDKYYGLYAIACEDLGMKPALEPNESVDLKLAAERAGSWLAGLEDDPDMAADTRVSVPVLVNEDGTFLWATLGVRLARLRADYARRPSIRPIGGDEPWKEAMVDPEGSDYEISIDEFAEVVNTGGHSLTRDELRAVCDRYQTKEKIVEALANWR